MAPRDYALEIEPGATPERLHEIEQVIRRALADELCRLAQMVDDQYLRGQMNFPTQAAQLCRSEAENHQAYT